jgi:hypothetical protein
MLPSGLPGGGLGDILEHSKTVFSYDRTSREALWTIDMKIHTRIPYREAMRSALGETYWVGAMGAILWVIRYHMRGLPDLILFQA